MPTEMQLFSKSATWLTAAALLAVLAVPAAAQQFQCVNSTGIGPNIRAEGTAELLGDIVLDCIGGIPTPHAQQIPQVNIVVELDTLLSSRVAAVNNSVQFLEALLFVDEPSTLINPTVPILNCGNTGAPDNTQAGAGVCAMVGGGS